MEACTHFECLNGVILSNKNYYGNLTKNGCKLRRYLFYHLAKELKTVIKNVQPGSKEDKVRMLPRFIIDDKPIRIYKTV
jgi:hypothetical protein